MGIIGSLNLFQLVLVRNVRMAPHLCCFSLRPDAPARRSQNPDLVGFLCIITWRANDSPSENMKIGPRSAAILATSIEGSKKSSYHNIDVMAL